MCTPFLPKMHTPRPSLKGVMGENEKGSATTVFGTPRSLISLKSIEKALQIKDFAKKLDTNQDTHCIKIGVRLWRRGWDSNPCAIARKLISSQPRYDHFDTSP